MKKNVFLKVSVIALAVFISVGAIYFTINPKQVISHANWVGQQNSMKEVFENSELALIAKVNASNSYEQNKVVFTNYSVSVDKVLKSNGSVPQDIEISLSGGDLNGVQYRFDKQKLLKKGDTYLFLLKKRYPKDANSKVYSLVGGYQGAINIKAEQVNNNKSYKGLHFNPDNNLEKELVDKDVIKELIFDVN